MSDAQTPTKSPPTGPTNPLTWIRELAAHNPQAATILLAGIASAAALAAVGLMGISLQSEISNLLILIAVGIGLVIFAGIINDKILFPVVKWFVTFMAMLWVVVLFVQVVVTATPQIVLPTTLASQLDCILYFWRECVVTADRVATKEAEQEQPLAIPDAGSPIVIPPSATVERGKYEVYVQFAGAIRRDDIRQMMLQLTAAGWNMQGVSGGGERTASADGYLEVRYATPADATAAEDLARSLIGSGRLTSLPSIVLTPSLQPADAAQSPHLEVWIGRDFGLSTRGAKMALQALELFSGPIDDVSDPELQEAVRAFQAQQGLVPDGLIGPATVQRLIEVLPNNFSFDAT